MKTIVVFSTPRSGSTFLTNKLSLENDLKNCGEIYLNTDNELDIQQGCCYNIHIADLIIKTPKMLSDLLNMDVDFRLICRDSLLDTVLSTVLAEYHQDWNPSNKKFDGDIEKCCTRMTIGYQKLDINLIHFISHFKTIKIIKFDQLFGKSNIHSLFTEHEILYVNKMIDCMK